MEICANNIDAIYSKLCFALLRAPKVGNTRELNNVMIKLRDTSKNVVSIRGISPSYLFGELLWYFTGRNDVEFISKFSSFWKKISDDGKTCNSAYGYLMKYAFGFDQIEKVIELLKKDPNSRRAKINLNTPREEVIETKDEPCTMFLQFLIRDEKLHCTAVMRSNDIWLGFPYDVAFFTELQKYIADQLGVGYGEYTHFVVSMHLYDRDYDKVKRVVEDFESKPVVFNSNKFHYNKDILADAIDLAGPECNAKDLLFDMLKLFHIYDETMDDGHQ